MDLDETHQWIPFLKQCIVVLAVSIHGTQYGLMTGFTAYLLPDLKRPDSKIPIDDEMGSWIVAAPSLSLLVVCLLMPWIMYRFGRRQILAAGVFGALITWLSMALAAGFTTIIVTRILQGFSICVCSVLNPLLISEYTSPKLRGSFLTVLTLFISSGNVLVHLMGSLINWHATAFILAVVSFINLVMLMFIPDSPSDLIAKEKYEEARKAFVWLRGKRENEELKSMIEFNMTLRSKTGKNYQIKSFVSLIKNLKELIKKPEFYKPIIIVLHLYSIAQFSCIFVLASYAVDMTRIIVSTDDVSAVIVGSNTTRMVTSVVFVFINKLLNRKTLLGFSVGLTIFSMLAISFYTYGVSHDLIAKYPTVATVLIHIHLFSLGAGTVPMPLVIAGELFPLQYRGVSSVLIVMFQAILTFTTLKTAPMLFKEIGLHWTYFIYASIMTYAVVFVLIFVPETKDRTLQDIEDEFRGRKATPSEVLELLDGKKRPSACRNSHI